MFPFTWQADYLLKGGTRPVTRVFGESMAVEVPEFTSDEAPAVMSWVERLSEFSSARNSLDVRMIDGNFYMQVADRMLPAVSFGEEMLKHGYRNDAFTRMFHSILQSKGNWTKHLDAFHAAQLHKRSGKGETTPSDDMIEHVLSHDRERREEQFRAVAEGVVIIDGAVWSRVCEPTIVIHDGLKENVVWNGTINTVSCAICVSKPTYDTRFVSGDIGISIGLPDTTAVYPITDWDNASAVHAAIAHPAENRYVLRRFFEDVRIHDPSVFRFDPICNPVARTVTYALAAFGKSMAKWSSHDIGVYMDVRSGLEEFEATGNVRSLEQAVDNLREFMDRSGSLDATALVRVKRSLALHTLDDAEIAFPIDDKTTLSYPHP
jgi:hypothetical protein